MDDSTHPVKGRNPPLTASYVTLHGAGFTDPARNTFAARARAAAGAGFTGVGSHLTDTFEHVGGPVVARQIAEENGVAITESELLTGWASATEDDWPEEKHRQVIEMADTSGLHHVTAGEFGEGPLDRGRAGENLARLAEPLKSVGTLVAIEPFRWAGIADYPAAIDIVRRSGATNVGLMLDVWHFFNSGADLGFLDEIDVQDIAAVQLNDGPMVDRDFQNAARETRWLPGDGELDVVGFVTGLREKEYVGTWCVEVNYPEFRALPVEDAARIAYEKAITILSG